MECSGVEIELGKEGYNAVIFMTASTIIVSAILKTGVSHLQ